MTNPHQRRIFKAMTPDQKLKTALGLYHSARTLKAAGLRALHPEWDEETINEEVRRIFFYART